MTKKLSCWLTLSLAAFAQVDGPTSGYVFDAASQELRPIRGIAGAAYLGGALIKGADAVSVSPDNAFAAVARQGRIELVRGFDSASPSRVVLVEQAANVRFAWSGQALAALDLAAQQGWLWRDAKSAPAGADRFELGGVDQANALAFDGENLLIASAAGLYLAKPGAAARRLEALADPSAIIAANGDAYVADRGANLVLRVRGYASAEASVSTFAAVNQPSGLLLNKQSLLVASQPSRSIEVFDLATAARTGSLDLDFTPTRLDRLGSRSLALMNAGSAEEPLFVLDYRDALAAFFVPAGREQ